MTTEADITNLTLAFEGLNAPVLLENAPQLLPHIHAIMPNWPFRTVAPDDLGPPCMVISGTRDNRYLCKTSDSTTTKRWDAVNAVCELIVELAWEQIRSNSSWLCLHCAAVEFNGRLVLFPNRRRAGKSTLTAILANRGYKVFTDDFLPVSLDPPGTIQGIANGVLPRVRLPLPEEFQTGFRDWVSDNQGPGNAQYKYLNVDNLAQRGESLPIGAVVVLDRDERAPPSLRPASQSAVLDDLVVQNFARTVHSAKILRASYHVSETVDLYRLSYCSAEAAADVLEQQFQSWNAPVGVLPAWNDMQEDGADLALLEAQSSEFDPSVIYTRAPGVTGVFVDDVAYLSDGPGLRVHRLNAGSAAIWRLLEDPATVDDITDLLCAAFPDIPRTQIEGDSATILRQFAANGLIQPAPCDRRTRA